MSNGSQTRLSPGILAAATNASTLRCQSLPKQLMETSAKHVARYEIAHFRTCCQIRRFDTLTSSSGIPSASVGRPLRLYQTLFHPNNPSNATDTQSPTGVQRVLECSLYNASYKVVFNLHSNDQQD